MNVPWQPLVLPRYRNIHYSRMPHKSYTPSLPRRWVIYRALIGTRLLERVPSSLIKVMMTGQSQAYSIVA